MACDMQRTEQGNNEWASVIEFFWTSIVILVNVSKSYAITELLDLQPAKLHGLGTLFSVKGVWRNLSCSYKMDCSSHNTLP